MFLLVNAVALQGETLPAKFKAQGLRPGLIGPPPLQTGRCPLAGTGEAREGGRRRSRCQLTLRNRPGRGPATGPGLPESRVTCCAGPRGGGKRAA